MRGCRHCNIVAQGFPHLFKAIKTHNQLYRQDLLRRLSKSRLKLSPDQQVEGLVSAANFDIRTQHHRIISLQEWVHELREGDFDTALIALGEIISLQHLGHSFMAQQFDGITQVKGVKPFALPAYFGQVRVNDSEKLVKIGLGVGFDLLGSQWFASLFSSAGITQTRCPIADDYNGFMAQALKLAQFAEDNCMPNSQVIVAWVYAELYAQRLSFVSL